MAELLSLSTVLGEHPVTATQTKRALATIAAPTAAARFARMLDASGNETRFFVLPLDEVRLLNLLEVRNRLYLHHAVRLGQYVAREALRRAEVSAKDITAVIGVSSTGHLMPTLETHLIDRLGLSPSCRRLPLTQLGCAGGTAGVGLAAAITEGRANTLLVSVELPSLSFPTAEPSTTDVIASMQFGDGAAAIVMSGSDDGLGPCVVGSGSFIFPGTLDRDGVRLTTTGLRLVRPRGLADILQQHLDIAVQEFLAQYGLSSDDVRFWVIHPRNSELLSAAASSLGLSDSALSASRTVWRRSGNLISAGVFHVLDELRVAAPPSLGAIGLMLSFGVGFTCDMVLLRAAGWFAANDISAVFPTRRNWARTHRAEPA